MGYYLGQSQPDHNLGRLEPSRELLQVDEPYRNVDSSQPVRNTSIDRQITDKQRQIEEALRLAQLDAERERKAREEAERKAEAEKKAREKALQEAKEEAERERLAKEAESDQPSEMVTTTNTDIMAALKTIDPKYYWIGGGVLLTAIVIGGRR